MKGLVVCVDYDDLLEITLVRNLRHLSECLVVTHPDDRRTQQLAAGVPGASVFLTDAFYRHGAKFNKSLAIEESFDALGRDGWILIWDADTLFPDELPLPPLDPENIYSPPRLILDDPRRWHPEFDWREAHATFDAVFAGYFQLFHASAAAISQRPWYDVTFTHAGGGDGYFQSRWEPHRKIKLPFPVLHLGPRDTNWCGRITDRRDDGPPSPRLETSQEAMRAYLSRRRSSGVRTRQDFEELVHVPGATPTGFVP